jgi:hypothetical protein
MRGNILFFDILMMLVFMGMTIIVLLDAPDPTPYFYLFGIAWLLIILFFSCGLVYHYHISRELHKGIILSDNITFYDERKKLKKVLSWGEIKSIEVLKSEGYYVSHDRGILLQALFEFIINLIIGSEKKPRYDWKIRFELFEPFYKKVTYFDILYREELFCEIKKYWKRDLINLPDCIRTLNNTINKNTKVNYVQLIKEKLQQNQPFTLGDIFDFKFARAYVIPEPLIGGSRIKTLYGLDIGIDNENVGLPIADHIRRIILTDEKGRFLYNFQYSEWDFITTQKALLAYPDTLIQKVPGDNPKIPIFKCLEVMPENYLIKKQPSKERKV